MSWSLIGTEKNKTAIKSLSDEIQEASNKGIILFCAAPDKGLYSRYETLYPISSNTTTIRAVGSANRHGAHSDFVNPDGVHYLFPGEEIDQLGLGEVKGSSAATALASGLAALIIWCFRKENKKISTDKRQETIETVFSRLKQDPNKFVEVTSLLGAGEETKSVKQVVDQCKSWVKY